MLRGPQAKLYTSVSVISTTLQMLGPPPRSFAAGPRRGGEPLQMCFLCPKSENSNLGKAGSWSSWAKFLLLFSEFLDPTEGECCSQLRILPQLLTLFRRQYLGPFVMCRALHAPPLAPTLSHPSWLLSPWVSLLQLH